ncbi:MAG: hypothetical protein V3V74_02430 [Nitrosomonadaceae bacterium]
MTIKLRKEREGNSTVGVAVQRAVGRAVSDMGGSTGKLKGVDELRTASNEPVKTASNEQIYVLR